MYIYIFSYLVKLFRDCDASYIEASYFYIKLVYYKIYLGSTSFMMIVILDNPYLVHPRYIVMLQYQTSTIQP